MKDARLKHRFILSVTVLAAVTACKDSTEPPLAPTVAAVTPAEGTVGTDLQITGTNFRAGASVLVGALTATSVDLTSATEIFAAAPSGIQAGTTYDVTVRNTDGSENTLLAAFTAVPPTLQFVNSATKPSGNTGSTVIIEGDAFGDAQGPGTVLFSDGAGGTIAAAIASPGDWTNTFIVTTVPTSAATGPVLVETGTGQSQSLPFTITQNAAFSPSTIGWTQTQGLPNPLAGHQAVFVPIDNASGQTVNYVYVTGGVANDDVPRADVNFAIIQGDGTLSGWTQATDLASPAAYHVAAAATPFNSKVNGSGMLYRLGGIDTTGGEAVTAVTRMPLNNDGTTGTPIATTSLPVPLHSFGAVVFRSALYIAGGATTGNTPVATVYRARIDTTGALGPWEALADLPSSRAYHDFVTFGGYLYAIGGDSAPIPPDDANYTQNGTKLNDVVFARINLRTGDLATAWSVNGTTMQKARSKNSTLAAGGNLFVSAGLYAAAGTGSSENSYAQINSDGTVGSFGGATGSNTLLSVGGTNLFNHAAIAYVDAGGVAHVMVLGGDDVNTPGSRQQKVFFY